MNPLALFVLALTLTLIGCGKGKTTDTSSDSFATVAEKKEFFERYVKFRRNFDDLHFRILFFDGGSGMVPGPSEWDIRLLAIVPVEEIDQWIDGLSAVTDPKLDWVHNVPNAPTDLRDFNWYQDDRRIVGIHRVKRIVLYRNHAS